MPSVKRILSAITIAAILLFMPSPAPGALAERTLDDAFAAADLAVPDYSSAIDQLASDIRASYSPSDGFQPGTMLMNYLHNGGRPANPNPYLMPESDGDKLWFMLAEGLMQYALDAQLDLHLDDETMGIHVAMDAGIDNDKCIVADGRVALTEGDSISEDSFYLRQTARDMRLKPPFSEEMSTPNTPDSAFRQQIRDSLSAESADWAEAINLLYAHLKNQPELRPMLEWAFEGAPAPDSFALTDRELLPMLRRLLLDLGTDAAFTDALGRTQLLDMASLSNSSISALADMLPEQRSMYIAGLLCSMSTIIESEGDPLEELVLDLRLDQGRISASIKTGVYNRDDPGRYDGLSEFAFQPTPNGFTARITASDSYDTNTISCALDKSGLDLAFQQAGRYSSQLASIRLQLTGARARLTFSDNGGSYANYGEVSLDWAESGDWTIGGSVTMDGVPGYTLTGSGSAEQGSIRGTCLIYDTYLPSFRAEYAASEGALDAQFALEETELVALHTEWSDTSALLSVNAMGQLIELGFSSEPIAGQDGCDYTVRFAVPDVQIDIDGRLTYAVDLSLPHPLVIDQSGELSVTADDETMSGSYALNHSFEVKERKHKEPTPSEPTYTDPAPAADDDFEPAMTDESDFVPAETEPAPAEPEAAPTRRPVNKVR